MVWDQLELKNTNKLCNLIRYLPVIKSQSNPKPTVNPGSKPRVFSSKQPIKLTLKQKPIRCHTPNPIKTNTSDKKWGSNQEIFKKGKRAYLLEVQEEEGWWMEGRPPVDLHWNTLYCIVDGVEFLGGVWFRKRSFHLGDLHQAMGGRKERTRRKKAREEELSCWPLELRSNGGWWW